VRSTPKGAEKEAIAYLIKAEAIFLRKLGSEHPATKDVQSWIDRINDE
jgi:hypothetical protein